MEHGAGLPGDLILKNVHQMGHAPKHICRGRNHARPCSALFLEAIKRPRIVVEALGEKLQLLPLHYRISIARCVKLRTLGEMSRWQPTQSEVS